MTSAYRLKLNSWVPLLTGHDCVTLGATIYCRKSALHRHTIAHEYCHVLQWQRYGRIGFLWRYLLEQLRHGYVGNRFEVEAHQYADAHETEFADVRAG